MSRPWEQVAAGGAGGHHAHLGGPRRPRPDSRSCAGALPRGNRRTHEEPRTHEQTRTRRHSPARAARPVVAHGWLRAAAEQDFLPPQLAYKYTATVADDELVVRYRHRARLLPLSRPSRLRIRDARGHARHRRACPSARTTRTITSASRSSIAGDRAWRRSHFDGAPRDFDLQLKLQGCADAGLCYPPQTWTTPGRWPATAAGRRGRRRRRGGFNLRRCSAQRPEVRRRLPARRPGLRVLGRATAPTASRCAGTSPTTITSIATR